jgi:hypothetical protein
VHRRPLYATLNLVRGVEILERDRNGAATAGQLSRQGAPAPGPRHSTTFGQVTGPLNGARQMYNRGTVGF